MLVREELEKNEWRILSAAASHADTSRGRARPEEECDIRTCYMRDRDRIVHCKAFRRLKDKTQVFLSPKGDHYRTRMLHTLEVSQTARTVARCLRLNEDLVEAIALGHDLGHTPYGHAGERALNSVCPLGFVHSEQSVRVAEVLEKNGRGLNLTWEVLDGMRNHGLSRHPATLEGQIVRLCDKISYIHHDMDDAERAGILKEEDIPEDLRELLGRSTRERLNTFIHDIVRNSRGSEEIAMSPDIDRAMRDLRRFMFENLYSNPTAKSEESKAISMIQQLYTYYMSHPEKMPEEYMRIAAGREEPVERAVCDYISGMTDQYSKAKFEDLFIPKSWSKM
ncbi:MAG: deoxyguanosinetriphosphate triphosphohydrolase [Chordicoccus sp.]